MIDYYSLPSQKFSYRHLFEANRLVDDSFASGYFSDHLNEIQCAWIALSEDRVVGWAAVAECMLRCVVVHPDYRKQGIGQELTRLRLEYLGYCDKVYSYAWVRPDGACMSCKNLENFGFTLNKELDDYYNNVRQTCKYCGGGCRCTAKQYIKINQH
jgi:ribosomal protein S18 acetylase RimI-like enzyme